MPRRNAVKTCTRSASAEPLRNPITSIPGCCARAASGHAAVPPTMAINSRRLMVPSNRGLHPTTSLNERVVRHSKIGHSTSGMGQTTTMLPGRLCQLSPAADISPQYLMCEKCRYCCKSLFALVIKNSPGCRRDFRVKMWGTSSPDDKLTGDLGNAIETTQIGGCRSDCFMAEKLSPGNFRLLQQYLP
jgi:hypothetical protein